MKDCLGLLRSLQTGDQIICFSKFFVYVMDFATIKIVCLLSHEKKVSATSKGTMLNQNSKRRMSVSKRLTG